MFTLCQISPLSLATAAPEASDGSEGRSEGGFDELGVGPRSRVSSCFRFDLEAAASSLIVMSPSGAN